MIISQPLNLKKEMEGKSMRYAVELHDLIKLKIEAANLTELDILGLIEIAKEIKAHAEAKK